MINDELPQNHRGFTLVEVLISVGIMVAIGFAIANFQTDLFSINTGVQNNLSAQLEGRKILRTVISELREASPSSLGAFPLAQAGTSTLTIYSNIDSDSYKERIRYFTVGNELRRGVLKPSGNPLVYNSANENVEVMIRNIINGTSTPIFEYFDENYTGTTTPLSQPVNVLSVRLVRITVIVDKDANRPPGAITITSQGMLRNLKSNQ
ncbi:MAG: hypothetical protein A3E93_02395 [Candidatus Zambryskibacteria bacterium RIFCSPHIGHO2_12_FULL_43_12b]|uniref:Type II secretion system protein J n=1 Tax=Candidatus Zambryskibacteria bacterium RIFCSPLOWO2_01_FULL_43_17 TaxID=1802760 RepID=A0A1G2U3Y7_9BACT|nr:MAG: hypothetical protein A3E93_02395 [Candidatus Zambryskibacteria bacterium RIFCSPHIGHO2_12_FULL_43_12b]OHB04231.1 MAG: hypothetical protein A2920_00780 [Candidatus Zambryskibacteria bacterium RIFCSPLOWO2_01_FULL_43_17]